MSSKLNEREEVFFRIFSLLISGIILYLWAHLILIIILIQFILVIFTNKKEKSLVDFCEIWNKEFYKFSRYITMASDEKPFPFNSIKTK